VESHEIFAHHFSVQGHRHIFTAMMYLYGKSVKPSALSIMEVLSSDDSRRAIEELGGLEYLMLLEESAVPTENLSIFAEKVKQSYTRKLLYQIAEENMKFMLSSKAETMNPSELIALFETKLTDMNASSASASDVYKMGDDTDAVLERRAETPSVVPGLECGMPDVDRYTNGGQGGDLIVICAESKTGKSVLLQNWESKIAIFDKLPTLYIDTEMYSRQQEDRKLAMLSGVPESEIVSGMYVRDTSAGTAEDKMRRLKDARDKLKAGNSYHVYMPHFTIEKVTALAKQFQRKFGIVALFFDYIKLPSSDGFKSAQEYQLLGFFTSGLKDLAGILNIPVYTACQANRDDLGSTNKDAKSIGGSYRILQLASKLMFLSNKSDEEIAKTGIRNGNQVLSIKYQRNGASDCPPVNIYFDKPILRMTEVS
jgi:replicative DNA helicase